MTNYRTGFHLYTNTQYTYRLATLEYITIVIYLNHSIIELRLFCLTHGIDFQPVLYNNLCLFIFHFNTDYVYDCGLYGNLKKNTVIQNMSMIM